MVQVSYTDDNNITTITNSVGKGKDYNYELDDRQQLVKTVNGAVAIDGWDGSRADYGDVVSVSAVFANADAEIVKGYWSNRTLVTVVLDNNETISNARIIVKNIKFPDLFEKKYQELNLEIWRV